MEHPTEKITEDQILAEARRLKRGVVQPQAADRLMGKYAVVVATLQRLPEEICHEQLCLPFPDSQENEEILRKVAKTLARRSVRKAPRPPASNVQPAAPPRADAERREQDVTDTDALRPSGSPSEFVQPDLFEEVTSANASPLSEQATPDMQGASSASTTDPDLHRGSEAAAPTAEPRHPINNIPEDKASEPEPSIPHCEDNRVVNDVADAVALGVFGQQQTDDRIQSAQERLPSPLTSTLSHSDTAPSEPPASTPCRQSPAAVPPGCECGTQSYSSKPSTPQETVPVKDHAPERVQRTDSNGSLQSVVEVPHHQQHERHSHSELVPLIESNGRSWPSGESGASGKGETVACHVSQIRGPAIAPVVAEQTNLENVPTSVPGEQLSSVARPRGGGRRNRDTNGGVIQAVSSGSPTAGDQMHLGLIPLDQVSIQDTSAIVARLRHLGRAKLIESDKRFSRTLAKSREDTVFPSIASTVGPHVAGALFNLVPEIEVAVKETLEVVLRIEGDEVFAKTHIELLQFFSRLTRHLKTKAPMRDLDKTLAPIAAQAAERIMDGRDLKP